MGKEVHVVKNQNLFVPHRVVKVGLVWAGSKPGDIRPPDITPPDTVLDPVGQRAIAKANESVRDLPKREKIIKVHQAGESGGVVNKNKAPSMVPAAIGDIYPGEHRYAYQLVRGDRIMQFKPNAEIGRYVRILDVELTYLNGKPVDAKITGTSETGNRVVLHMQGNAQVRLVTDTENPYG